MLETRQPTPPGHGHYILEAKDLERSYGPRRALRGLSFSLEPGHVLGFLGPNGAGKTTTIRILTTMLEPSAGQFTVKGIASDQPEKIRRKIGVLPESLGFPRHITGIEYLTFFGQLYGRSASEAREYGWALLKDVGLDQRGRSLIGSYSHGMRQRLGIARALVNDPVVVFLDEPTLGLDPRGQQELLALVRRIAQERHAGVVLCSHLLSEIESVCDDVVILSSGQVVAKGTVADVIGGAQRNVIRIHVPASSVARAQELLQAAQGVSKVTQTSQAGWLRVDLVDPGDATQDHRLTNGILESLIRADVPIQGFEAQGGRLQEAFLHLTERVAR
jgi:ABC-2 type transport system ATP-binding protein